MIKNIYQTIAPDLSSPVTLAEFKQHLRVVHESEDAYLQGLLDAATRTVEQHTRRQMNLATWHMVLDCFPDWEITFPIAPVNNVSDIRYYDVTGAHVYYLDSVIFDNAGDAARLTPAVNGIWPATYPRIAAVNITFEAGYGDDADDVPASQRLAIKLLASHWYENREPVIVGSITAQLPYSLRSLIWNEKWTGYFEDRN